MQDNRPYLARAEKDCTYIFQWETPHACAKGAFRNGGGGLGFGKVMLILYVVSPRAIDIQSGQYTMGVRRPPSKKSKVPQEQKKKDGQGPRWASVQCVAQCQSPYRQKQKINKERTGRLTDVVRSSEGGSGKGVGGGGVTHE
jgi:hypothetical protein